MKADWEVHSLRMCQLVRNRMAGTPTQVANSREQAGEQLCGPGPGLRHGAGLHGGKVFGMVARPHLSFCTQLRG